MKKLSLTLLVILGAMQLAFSQVDFGIKAGVNYNFDTFKNIKNDVLKGAKSKMGYHGGIWARFDLGSISARTELIYTELKSDVDVDVSFFSNSMIPRRGQDATFIYKKIDIPLLLEINFMKIFYASAGPSFQYVINSDFNLNEFITDKNIHNKFSVGLQTGLGVKLGKFGIDVRWERAFKDSEMEFYNKNVSTSNFNVKFDHRMHQVVISASYAF